MRLWLLLEDHVDMIYMGAWQKYLLLLNDYWPFLVCLPK